MANEPKNPTGVKGHETTLRKTASDLEAILDSYRAAVGLSPVAAKSALPANVALRTLTAELRGRADALVRDAKRPKFRSDQLLVTLDPRAVRDAPAGTDARSAARFLEVVEGPFAALEREGLIEDVTAVGQVGAVDDRRGVRSLRALTASVAPGVDEALAGVNLVRVGAGASIDELRRRLDAAPAVREIERVPYRTIAPPSRPRPLAAAARGGRPRPWNLAAIGWASINPPNASRVRVAVLDTGVDEGHPDLEIAAYETGEVSDEDIVGHGTHVCGIIAGRASRRGRFVGGVSNPALHVWKIFSDELDPEIGERVVDEVLYQRALIGALRAGCRVMNLSIGGVGTTRRERALFERLVDGGVVIVAAMGNEYEDGNPTEYPAAHDGVIAVGAVGRDLTRASFSNTGSHIALVAPGVDIHSTLPRTASEGRPETGYASWEGTSMAAPHVAGAAARLLARRRDLTPAEVKAELQDQARKLPAMNGRDWTRLYGAGLLQV